MTTVLEERGVITPPRDPRANLALVAIVFFAAGLLVVLTLAIGPSSLSLGSVVVGSGVVLALLFFFLHVAGWRDPGDPIIFYPLLLWFVFGYVELSVSQEELPEVLRNLSEGALVGSYALVLLGLAAFMIAYAIVARPTARILLDPGSLGGLKTTRVMVVVAAIFVARLGLLSLGNFGYLLNSQEYAGNLAYTGLLNVLTDLSPFALLLMGVLAFRRRAQRWERVALGVVVFVELGFGLISGTKIGLVLPAVAIGLAYLYTRGSIPWKPIVIGLLIFLFFVPGIERYRELLNTGGERVSSPSAAFDYGVQALNETFTNPSVSERVSDGSRFMLGRLDSLRAFALVRSKTPAPIPYERGKLYLIAPLFNVVPRILWPSKPILDIGLQTFRDYYGGSGNSSVTRTLPGDFYANFGVPGLFVGMFFLGLVVAALRRSFVRGRTVTGLLVYAVGFFTLMNYEADFASLLAGLPRILVTVLIVAWFTTSDRANGRRQAKAAWGEEAGRDPFSSAAGMSSSP